MAELSQEEMAQMQAKKGGGADPQAVTGLIQQVGQGIGQLAEMVNKLPQAGPEARAAMMSAMEAFSKAVQVMQGGGEQEESQEPMDGGAVAMEGGSKGVPMGPNMRQ